MSTRYILHGGNAQDKNNENIKFFKEILKYCKNEANILLVQFAATPEKQEIYKARHISQFEEAKDDKKLNYQVATNENFNEQLKWADVIYLCGSSGGGATTKLIESLRKFDNLKTKIDDKTIAGESAGTNSLTTICYSKSGGIIRGLGLVPFKSIVHYVSGDENYFKGMYFDIESLYLKSYQFIVYTS